MEDLKTLQQNDPFRSPFDQQGESARKGLQREAEDWEDWEDNDEPTTPIDTTAEAPLVDITTTESPRSKDRRKESQKSETRTAPPPRYSIQKPLRLKSRKRQQAQNAKAGIKLVTDMTRFRKEQQQHIVQAMRPDAQAGDWRTGKFVDAAALRALEGSPNEGSVGNWNWLKRRATNKRKQRKAAHSSLGQQGLSPADRPIVIGITLPEDDLAGRVISPQTATLETPLDLSKYSPNQAPTLITQDPNRSVWSPDTEDGSPFPSSAASGLCSPAEPSRNVPPVPSMPFGFKSKPKSPAVDDDDDAGTPITLFEEDGSPVYTRKSFKAKGHARSPATTITRSGWWDHVQTPFVPSPVSPLSAKPASPVASQNQSSDEWWKASNANEKKKPLPAGQGLGISTTASSSQTPADRSTTIASSSRAPPPQPEAQTQTISEKARILAEQNEISRPMDEPPPYEPAPPKQEQIRYHAVFPPGHPFQGHASSTTRPASPGLAHTMTSQSAHTMTDVPLTPAHLRASPTGHALPERPVGTYLPSAYLDQPVGDSPAAKTERQRRRHEKEDAIARRIEGFWKGRGCISSNGCYGRRGREGRQRRRIILAVIVAVLVLTILAIILGVTLSRKAAVAVGPAYSFWLNVTNFPPVPTGVTTLIGPDNNVASSICILPRTVWSCSLGPDDRGDNLPYRPEQPSFIFQIQYDNNTRQLWNFPDGPIPTPSPKPNFDGQGRVIDKANNTNGGVDSSLNKPKEQNNGGVNPVGRRQTQTSPTRTIPQLYDPGFNPSPAPPAFEEMYFLGNTTDNIVSDRKAGEPTPFYISLLRNINATVGPNIPALSRRGLINTIGFNASTDLPPPELNRDGTPANPILRPFPVQQPLRLYDRGLPTEHLGFYNYFNKTIYVKSTAYNETVADDEDGGVSWRDAKHVVTWTQVRFKVKIWTRMGNETFRFIGGGAGDNSTQPGTFPYPITVTEDTHGGSPTDKGIYVRKIVGGKILTDTVDFLIPNLEYGGTLINGGTTNFDLFSGGVDGGTGGCKCGWTNFLSTTKGGQ